MKDSKIYLERMEKSMQEKLFFIKNIDLRNKIVIDFGCADGTLIRYLKNFENRNVVYIGVEKRKEFADKAKKITDYVFSNLHQTVCFLLGNTLNIDYKKHKIVFITSSVLHECDLKTLDEIKDFVWKYCSYWVIRDMYYNDNHENKYEYSTQYILYKIIKKTDPKQWQSWLQERPYTSKKNLAEYLMKYPYVENWETELKEKYFSTDFLDLVESLRRYKNVELISFHTYTNNYIRERIYKDFKLNIWFTTHCQMIMKLTDKTDGND